MTEGFGWLERDRELGKRDVSRSYGKAKREAAEAVAKVAYSSGFVPDAAMADKVVPKSSWTPALAAARSAIFADTCKIFHRAQAPTSADRYSITFSWTSTTAVKEDPTMALTDAARPAVLTRINARQKAVLPQRVT